MSLEKGIFTRLILGQRLCDFLTKALVVKMKKTLVLAIVLALSSDSFFARKDDYLFKPKSWVSECVADPLWAAGFVKSLQIQDSMGQNFDIRRKGSHSRGRIQCNEP